MRTLIEKVQLRRAERANKKRLLEERKQMVADASERSRLRREES